MSCLFLASSNDYQRLSPLPNHLFSFFFLFLFLFSSLAILFSPYPSAINITHQSHSSGLQLQLKLKSSFCSVSISISVVGLVISGYGLSSQWHRRGFGLGIYRFIFVCVKRVCICCFWVVAKREKILKFGVGKRENMGYG